MKCSLSQLPTTELINIFVRYMEKQNVWGEQQVNVQYVFMLWKKKIITWKIYTNYENYVSIVGQNWNTLEQDLFFNSYGYQLPYFAT